MPGTFTENTQTEPAGFIKLWTSDPGNIPPGWAICDGNNGTPDLRLKFPRAVPSNEASSGNVGGSHSITITESQLPPHSHSASVDTLGDHYHLGWYQDVKDTGSGGYTLGGDFTSTTTSNGSHSHSFDIPSDGGGSSVENEPIYQTVHFIMKL